MDATNPIIQQLDSLERACRRSGYLKGWLHALLLVAAIAAAAFLTGCGHIGGMDKPVEDWPRLTVIDNGSTGLMAECSKYTNLLTWPPLGCAVVNFDTMTCNIWWLFGWVRDEELKHCFGEDHPGETTLRDLWANYKGKR